LTEGLEIQDGMHRQSVWIDNGGMMIGRKDQVHCMMTEKAIVIGKSEGESAKVVAAIGSSEDAGFVLLQAKDQEGTIVLNAEESRLGWDKNGQGVLAKRQ
jgi:hypothetical protein